MQEDSISIQQLSTEQIDAFFGLSESSDESLPDNELLRLFIKEQSEGYIEPFKKAWLKSDKNLAITLNKLGFHWGCFWVPYIVLGYRKQYFWIFLSLMVTFIIWELSELIQFDLSIITIILIRVPLSQFFKRIYIEDAVKSILAIKNDYKDKQIIIEAIKQKGGTSILGAITGTIITFFSLFLMIVNNYAGVR